MQTKRKMNKILLGLSILIFASCGNGSSKSNRTENSSESQFQWDFSKQRKFIYSFSQTVNGENKMDKDRPAEKTYMSSGKKEDTAKYSKNQQQLTKYKECIGFSCFFLEFLVCKK